jgi:hypothetical protein
VLNACFRGVQCGHACQQFCLVGSDLGYALQIVSLKSFQVTVASAHCGC